VPSEQLATFNQEMSAGTWSLTLADAFVNHGGTLTGWSLEICTAESADFSDAASSYGVAFHAGEGALRIGSDWDSDTNSATAQDDDTDDGITFDSPLKAGDPFTMTVDVVGAAADGVWVAAWFDWNGDGDFGDAGEATFDQAGSVTELVLNAAVPADALMGDRVTYRVRVYDSGADPMAQAIGSTSNGEVTDGTAEAVSTTPTAMTLQSVEIAEHAPMTLLLFVSMSLAGLIALHIQRKKK
jgi:hypothetical protein